MAEADSSSSIITKEGPNPEWLVGFYPAGNLVPCGSFRVAKQFARIAAIKEDDGEPERIEVLHHVGQGQYETMRRWKRIKGEMKRVRF